MRRAAALTVTALLAAACGTTEGKTSTASSPSIPPTPPMPVSVSVSATTSRSPTTGPRAKGIPASPARSLSHGRPARYVFPVRGCRVEYGPYHHDYPASDIFTAKGCEFVAVTDGHVDEVTTLDAWNPRTDLGAARGGKSVSIIGDDGVRYYGSHLESVAPGIFRGARVTAGTLLGRIDNSGDARWTATHVHFGISWPTRPGVWWVRRGEVSPWPYLRAWQSGRALSPATAVTHARAALGTEPRCHAEC